MVPKMLVQVPLIIVHIYVVLHCNIEAINQRIMLKDCSGGRFI